MEAGKQAKGGTKYNSRQASGEAAEEQVRLTQAYYQAVSKRLYHAIGLAGLSQGDVVERCAKIGYTVAQGTVSKLLSLAQGAADGGGDQPKRPASLSLIHVVYLCKALGLDLGRILDVNTDVLAVEAIAPQVGAGAAQDSFVVDPEKSAFKGYLGQYYCYFNPTISSEQKLLSGTLTFSENRLERSCEALLELDTNLRYPDGTPITKRYNGTLVVSVPQDSCYCTLTNTEYGEICMLNFHHRFFITQEQKLQCRLAAAITTSAGEHRRPTVHRMLITRDRLTDADLELLKPQLQLNSAEIAIAADTVRDLIERGELPREVAALFGREIPGREYYVFDEFKVLGVELEYLQRAKALCLLRKHSLSPKYNKVGSKADELIYKYLTQRPRAEQEENGG